MININKCKSSMCTHDLVLLSLPYLVFFYRQIGAIFFAQGKVKIIPKWRPYIFGLRKFFYYFVSYSFDHIVSTNLFVPRLHLILSIYPIYSYILQMNLCKLELIDLGLYFSILSLATINI